MKKFSVFLVLSAIFCIQAVDIVKSGKAQAEIALPDNAVLSAKFAAKELQKHIKLVSGAELPIVNSQAPRKLPNRIHLGYGAAPADKSPFAWRIKAEEKDLYIHGNDKEIAKNNLENFSRTLTGWWVVSSGTLMGTFDFLDREIGIRWYRPSDDGIFAPRSKDISIAAFDRQAKPRLTNAAFSHISIYNTNRWKNRETAFHYVVETQLWLLRHRVVSCAWYDGGHAFTTYWKRYGKKHPEYFAKLHDGTRRPLAGDTTGKYITMCVSSPALLKQIVADYRRGYGPQGKFKERYIISLGENDTPGMCTCSGCRAWDMPEFDPNASSYWRDKLVLDSNTRFSGFGVDEGGTYSYEKTSLTDRYAKFWLTVQQELRKIEPDVTVMGYAYLNTVLPPKHVKLNKNILVVNVGLPFYPLTEDRLASFWKEWNGWMATGCTMSFRPNTTWSGGAYPLQYGERIGAVYRKLLREYPRVVQVNFDSLRGEYSNMGPMWYILARLTYRSDLTIEEIKNEYFGCFGNAGKALREYFDYWKKISDAVTSKQVAQWEKELGYKFMVWNNTDMCVKIFNPSQFAHAAKILKKAESDAKNAREKEIVKFFQLGLEHARLTWTGADAHLKRVMNDTPENQALWKQKRAPVLKFRAQHEGKWFTDTVQNTSKENYGYNFSKPAWKRK